MIRTVLQATIERVTTALTALTVAFQEPGSDSRTPAPLAIVAALVAGLAGFVVFALAVSVFPYHSSNHDEAVYLLQAAMLLEGQLELHVDSLTGAFQPWFFIADGERLYPKYTPVPAAMFAGTMALFGEPRVTLAIVTAANTGLVYLLGTIAFDRRVGVLAAVLFAAAPLTLVTSSVFLPYAPTTALNLVFAVGYLRGVRDQSVIAAAVAGVAVGVAFFARPYTAVLFATPFMFHAAYRVVSAGAGGSLRPVPDTIRRNGVTAAIGLVFVGITLAYNLRMTGSAVLFPYEAFAPADGPGFGRRRILGHSIVYSPAVALRASAHVVWYFATRWFTAGPLGTGLAAVGLVATICRWHRGRFAGQQGASDHPVEGVTRFLLAGLFVSVTVGNLFFWGNYNILATVTDPTDGLISQFGPVYHFDLLAPLAVFGAVGLVTCRELVSRGRAALGRRLSPQAERAAVIVVILAGVLVGGVASAAVVAEPLERNGEHTARYETAYEPIESSSFEKALIFVPTPYGDWHGHPFQSLRNDPGFDGSAVYALDRDAADDFAVVDKFPERTPYRYTYQGEWTPEAAQQVDPKLEPLAVKRGSKQRFTTTVGVPDRVDHARVRLETTSGDGTVKRAIGEPGDSLAIEWTADADTVRMPAADGDDSLELVGTQTVVLQVTLVQPGGGTLTYRQEVALRSGSATSGETVEVVWPPDRYVCTLVTDCGNRGTYLPDEPDAHRDGVEFRTRVDTVE